MEITYDKGADAIYIEFSNADFSKNKKIDSQTIIDLDKNDQIIGIDRGVQALKKKDAVIVDIFNFCVR